VAVAELIDEKSATKMEIRVTEISLNGCYFDMVNPLPDGTPIHLKIFFEHEFFEAKGKVVYNQPNIGMGATFEELPAYSVPVETGMVAELIIGNLLSARWPRN